ncbi:hypothetical protein LOD99_10200 [Oopsacas minuta]|uniref:Septin-type G domain-containing protein n=1 Tax=Oopsacas minuta TaxID=111878 RepID=A0AAV7KIX3_9METZ|nr:hypothetical protein LOD99_10200 [Oopsacas minuta]
MLLELFSLLITICFIFLLSYIIKIQRDLISQSNRNERTTGAQNTQQQQQQQQDPLTPVNRTLPQPNIATTTYSSQVENDQQVESVNEEEIKPVKSSAIDRNSKADTKKTGWTLPGFSSITSKLSSIVYTKTKEEIEHENIENINNRLKAEIIKQSQMCAQLPTVKIYKLKLNQTSYSATTQIKKFEFGKSKTGSYVKNEKVIMILGATGSGKTTLINSMINYLFGVKYTDEFRFKLVTETEDGDGGRSQAHSPTSWITAYTIHHRKGFKINHTLTIIDTPGFGDTRGIQRDAEITKQIHNFFTIPGAQGIDHIDAVGFIAQSSLPRLTFTQKYVFDQILALFGKDIGGIIYLLLTFADGKAPQVLNGINEARMPFQEFFKFNNSVIFDDNTTEDEFASMFWQMGMRSFEKFFSHFSKIQPKSLIQTKSVLEERERIETQIVGLQSEIQLGLNKLEQLKREVAVVEQHKSDLARNKDFTYIVNEDTMVKHDLPQNTYVTICLTCNFTCHYPCPIADDEKHGCAAMDGGGRDNAKCTVCYNRCSWTQHKNMRYYFTTERREVKKTSEDLKMRYLDASGKVKSATQIVDEMVDEFEAVQIKVVCITEVLRKSINKLNEIALKPNPLSTGEYIRILIESEKANPEPGWEDRIVHLNDVKMKVDNLAKVTEEGFDPFEAYKIKIREEKQTKEGVWSSVGSYLKKIDFF